MPLTIPTQTTVIFGQSGLRNTIPVASQIPITPGAASYTDGFPPVTMQPVEAGGVPPFGQDMNGILYAVSQAIQWMQSGSGYPYSSSWATAVGGYPLGALVQMADGYSYWRNTAANNTSNPETGSAGWETVQSGITTVALSNANYSLTVQQATRPIIVLSGALTANVNLIFPTAYKQSWIVYNGCTGGFQVTCKTAAGAGVIVQKSQSIFCDGADILSANADGFSPGTVAHFAASSAPAGWLKANGAAVSRTAYAALFAVIGTTYGAGDGSTTFNLPDLRGQFVRGFDDGRGLDSGRVFGSNQNGTLTTFNADGGNEVHGLTVQTQSQTDSDPISSVPSGVQSNFLNNGSVSTGINFFGRTRPTNVALLACIKF